MDLKEVENRKNQRHPWEICRRKFFTGIIAETVRGAAKTKILDVGAGDGWVSQGLSGAIRIGDKSICWDINYTQEDLDQYSMGAASGLQYVCERPQGKFDLILMLDVLEHVENDGEFLGKLVSENLETDGIALISVPAWPALFSSHDRALDHFRRYTPEGARTLLAGQGLRVLRSGGLFHSLIFPRAMQVIGEKWGPNGPAKSGVGGWSGGALATSLIVAALSADNKLSALLSRIGISAPGLSWWAVCQKNS
ncbi:MAG: methyltransferase domain-containing protein [Rhodospirillaceae bacterium]|jgi:hypothetical protein|nr:methyltransferase domain-containing protein [Rhodospirillaceae bacterium]